MEGSITKSKVEWITDKPPREDEYVLITHNVGMYEPIYRTDSAWVEYDKNGEIYFNDTGYGDMFYGEWGERVIAWKPLPEPYKENG